MRVEKNVPVHVRDGNVLRANVYRPDAPGRYPVLMTHGPYGKDVHFADGYPLPWEKLKGIYPNIDS